MNNKTEKDAAAAAPVDALVMRLFSYSRMTNENNVIQWAKDSQTAATVIQELMRELSEANTYSDDDKQELLPLLAGSRQIAEPETMVPVRIGLLRSIYGLKRGS